MVWTDRVSAQLEAVYHRLRMSGSATWLDDPLPIPRWAFLCWLTDHKGLLLHGSGDPAITEFEPRRPDDHSADAFSKQTAVFAASDGIWAIWYAIIDRTRYRLNMLNGAVQFEVAPGTWSVMHYFFSITAAVLAHQPWRDGVVYLLPRAHFVQQPPYRLGRSTIREPHWACVTGVRPLAKLRVQPTDFPLLADVRGHDPMAVQHRAARDPSGFPWVDADV